MKKEYIAPISHILEIDLEDWLVVTSQYHYKDWDREPPPREDDDDYEHHKRPWDWDTWHDFYN